MFLISSQAPPRWCEAQVTNPGLPGACSLRWARRRRRVADVGRAGTDRQGPALSQPCHLLPCGHSVGRGLGGLGRAGGTARPGMDAWGSTAHTKVWSSDRAKSSCRWGVGRGGGGQELPQGEGSSARREDRGRVALADTPNPKELGTDESEGGTRAGPAPVGTKALCQHLSTACCLQPLPGCLGSTGRLRHEQVSAVFIDPGQLR